MTIQLPTTSKWVNTKDLHPKFQYRLNQFFLDSRIKGRVLIVSGARSFASQDRLYKKWRAYKNGTGPKANLAASPNYVRSNGFKGSLHQVQTACGLGGTSVAVDLRIIKKKEITEAEVDRIMNQYGMQAPLKNKGEWWHFVPGEVKGKDFLWFPAEYVAGDETMDAKKMVKADNPLKVWARAVAEARKHVLRRGSRGVHVEVLQTYLEQQGFLTGKKRKASKRDSSVDGIFGNNTRRAVIEFQQNELTLGNTMKVDGIMGPLSWSALVD
jgi:murein L,D-transpeptidase YcbB/YkuD